MQCVRFLADYINGDTYYKIKYPEHNLVRTKAQFKLLQSVEEHTPEMVAFINECLKSENRKLRMEILLSENSILPMINNWAAEERF